MKNEQAQRIIAEHFSKKVRKDPKIRNAYLLVHSDKLGVHLNIAEGSADHAVNANQPYFIASIGKLFTSVLIGILVEKAMISYEDPLHPYIDPDLLHNLHSNGKTFSRGASALYFRTASDESFVFDPSFRTDRKKRIPNGSIICAQYQYNAIPKSYD